MSTTLYYAKINLNSAHIFKVYSGEIELEDILKKLFISISNDVKYVRTGTYEGIENYRGEYLFANINKNEEDLSISGSIIKKGPVFVNQRDSKNILRKVAVNNEETINFYLDTLKETVAFYTTQRFGYQEFVIALNVLLNKSIKQAYSSEDEQYYFNVALLRKNLNMDDIRNELKKLKNIEVLKIDIIPPNPDPKIVGEIQKNGEKRLESMKSGNVTYKSTLLQSKSSTGIVLDSEIVSEEIAEAENLHSKLSSEESLRNGYVQVEAISKDGRTYSTKEGQPIKYIIDKEDVDDMEPFIKFCKQSMETLFD